MNYAVLRTTVVVKIRTHILCSVTFRENHTFYEGKYYRAGEVREEKAPTPCVYCGPGISVGIATDLRAGRSGNQHRWGEFFRPSSPALWPNQTPVQWVPSLSRE